MSRGMILDGVIGGSQIDRSGEVLDIKGANIDGAKDGTMFLNWEHQNVDKTPNNVVGKVIYAKKIYKDSDCDNDRQLMYFKKVNKTPIIYGIMRLFDRAGHIEAQNIAAIIRDHHANKEPVAVKFSVEGSTLDKKDNIIKQCIIKKVALTLSPCNAAATSSLLEDSEAPAGFDKQPVKEKQKSLLSELVDKNEFSLYQKLGASTEIVGSPLLYDVDSIKKSLKILAKAKLLKALSAGSYDVAPSTLVGGAALQREDLHRRKKKMVEVLEEYGDKPFDKAEFRALVKFKLPEMDDEYIDHFVNGIEDFNINRKTFKKNDIYETMHKLESIDIDLRKAMAEPTVNTVFFGGHRVQPGHAETAEGNYALLHENDTHYVGIPSDKLHSHTIHDLVRLPKHKENSHYLVTKKPHVLVMDLEK